MKTQNLKGYKVTSKSEPDANGIWLADKSNDTARCLTSDKPDYIWKEWFADLPIDVIVEEIPLEFEEPKQTTGFHLNVNVINQETLLKAIEQPELYPSLVVRISGYATYFNALTEEQKQDIVTRTFHKQM